MSSESALIARTGLTRLSALAFIRLCIHLSLHTSLPSLYLRYLAPRSRPYTESSWQAQARLVPVRHGLHNSCTVVFPWFYFFKRRCHLCLVRAFYHSWVIRARLTTLQDIVYCIDISIDEPTLRSQSHISMLDFCLSEKMLCRVSYDHATFSWQRCPSSEMEDPCFGYENVNDTGSSYPSTH